MVPSPQGLTFKNDWIVGKKLGSGACCDVYEVKPTSPPSGSDPLHYVIKIAPLDFIPAKKGKKKMTDAQRKADTLYMESLLYQNKFHARPGIAKIPLKAYGSDQGYRYFVMERLGRSLEDIKQAYGSIPSSTAARLGMDILDTIMYMHNQNVLYVDIKPENFLMDRENENQVYCIDFGVTDRITLATTGKHKDLVENTNLIGTPAYLSLNCHLGANSSRRDDIEALLNVLLYLIRGNLPWQDAKSDQEGARIKQETSITLLCASLPHEWMDMMKDIRSLKFQEKPNYTKLMNTFQKLSGSRLRSLEKYQWEGGKEFKSIPTKASKKVPIKKEVQVAKDLDTHKKRGRNKDLQKEEKSAVHEPKSIDKRKAARSIKETRPRVHEVISENESEIESEEEEEYKIVANPTHRRKAAQRAVAGAAAASAAAKEAALISSRGTDRYDLRSRN